MLKDLIDLCLSIKPNKRPSFENIVGLLAGMLKEIESGGVAKRHHRKKQLVIIMIKYLNQ